MTTARLRFTPLAIGVAVVVVVAVLACALGPVALPPAQIVVSLLETIPWVHLGGGLDPTGQAILFQIRLPRVVLGALVGGLLALAGAGYQGVFRNPLVDSGMLGASAGAGLGATLAIVYLGGTGPGTVPVAAFVGSLAGVAAAYATGTAASSVRAIQAVEKGTSDTANRCAKFTQINRGVVRRTSRNR